MPTPSFRQSRLSYDELIVLLGTSYIRAFVAADAPNPKLSQSGSLITCDLTKLSISGFNVPPSTVWNELHRFLRLQRLRGYTIDETDVLVTSLTSLSLIPPAEARSPSASLEPVSAFREGDAARSIERARALLPMTLTGSPIEDDLGLGHLAVVEHFREDRGVEPFVIASWFGAIDTRRRGITKKTSFYERVFQPPSVRLPVDHAFDLANPDGPATPTELAHPEVWLKDHADALRSSLGLRAADLALLLDDDTSITAVGAPAELPSTTTKLNLEALSKLHRLVTFARALKLSIVDLLALKRLFGDATAESEGRLFTPSNTYLFAQTADKVQAGKLTPADLLFVFYGHTGGKSALLPKASDTTSLVDRLGSGQVALRMAALTTTCDDETLLLPVLRLLFAPPVWGEADVTKAYDILAGRDADDAWFGENLATFFAHDDANTRFFGEDALEPGPARWAYAYGQLKAFVEGEQLILQTIAAAVDLPTDVIAVLLNVLQSGDEAGGAIADHCRLEQYNSVSGTPPMIPPLTAADHLLLARAAAPLRALRVPVAELIRLCVYGGAESSDVLLDLDALVHATPASAVTPEEWFRRWLLFTELWSLRGELAGGPVAFLSMLPSDPAETGYSFIDRTAEGTGWARADVVALATRMLDPSFLDEAPAAPPPLPALCLALVRLRFAMRALRPFAVDAKTAIEKWIPLGTMPLESLPTSDTSASVVHAVRASVTDAEWSEIARPLRDKVREGQRAALVDYLTTSGYARNADELYAWLLVDVEMSPCMLTSRIKQATGSVQTFVQRALLNLEPGVLLDKDQAEQWSWMKNYRVWEASRKIFLYPENWIEPSLRGDKSPLFEQLESELRRQPLDDESTELAYVHYLEGLVDVAALEVMAIHHETDDVDAIHLVGRTHSDPHRYYYTVGTRDLLGTEKRVWAPWEPLELEIEGDHLLLTKHNGRLQLFWAQIEQKPNASNESAEAGSRAQTHLEVRLVWTERRAGRWAAPQTSMEALSSEGRYSNKFPNTKGVGEFDLKLSDVTLAIIEGDADLKIGCFVHTTRLLTLALAMLPPTFILLGAFDVNSCTFHIHARPMLGESLYADRHEGKNWINSNEVGVDSVYGGTVGTLTSSWRYSSQFEMPGTLVTTLDLDDGLWKGNLLASAVLPSAQLMRTLRFARTSKGLVEVGAPHATRMPLVFSSSAGTLQGTAFVFERAAETEGQDGVAAVNLFHPKACTLLTTVRRSGLGALWEDRELQRGRFTLLDQEKGIAGKDLLEHESEMMDFDYGGLYATYNWELFFHAPLLIATRLSADRRYEEAQRWFHRIFDPTAGRGAKGKPWAEPPYSLWRFRPFFENQDLQTIQKELEDLSVAAAKAAKTIKGLEYLEVDSSEVRETKAEIEAWRRDPFDPHAIARMRVLAYQKATVLKYIDNLIAWGDDLFRRDTIESITEATQIYLLAREILGPRPRKVYPPSEAPPRSAGELSGLDDFSNALIATESLVPWSGCGGCKEKAPPWLLTQYFCVPGNERIGELADVVTDRLFKIRHCLNLDGVFRELALFEPPIDPALLVQAAAAGIDINSVMNDLSAGALPYRFTTVHARAMELAAGTASLGQALLQALEKGDSEALARLRSVQEIEVLRSARESKVAELKEASAALETAQASQAVVEVRIAHYESLLEAGQSEEEEWNLRLREAAGVFTFASQTLSAIANGVAFIPDASVAVGMVTGITRLSGGDKAGLALRLAADAAASQATIANTAAEALSTTAGYQRRTEEWTHQVAIAKADLEQAKKQVATAQLRVAVATASLSTHDLQREHAAAVDEFMKSKLTNEGLYQWMADRLSDVYYEAYKAAYDMAKRAERAFQMELAVDGAPKYVTFGYWDSARRGLVAGEQLMHSLRMLDVAYLEGNRRELEIVKHVSLASLSPTELIALRETGECSVEVGEELFTYDFPRHYLRRLRRVRLSLSGVAGPYTGVNCTLRLDSSVVRRAAKTDSEPVPASAQIQAIVTSAGQLDSGLFEPNLNDERYLPFEGAGAVSLWHLSLPLASNGFDLRTVSDVVLHLEYTARDGGAAWQGPDVSSPRKLERLIDVRAEHASAWALLLSEGPADVALAYRDFPYLVGEQTIAIGTIHVYVRTSDDGVTLELDTVEDGEPSGEPLDLDWGRAFGLRHGTNDQLGPINVEPDGSGVDGLRLSFGPTVDLASVRDIYIVLEYKQAVDDGATS